MIDLLPGTFGTTPTFGNTFDRSVARAIQWFTATRDQYGRWHDAPVNHAVLYVGEVPGYDQPQIVEAAPGGANFSDWNAYGTDMVWAHEVEGVTLNDQQRASIAQFGIDCAIKGVGYGYLDFVAIALAQRRMHSIVFYEHTQWWAKRLGDPHRLICSQLVDWCYLQADVHLFSDGRWPGLVSPADLRALTLG